MEFFSAGMSSEEEGGRAIRRKHEVFHLYQPLSLQDDVSMCFVL